MHGIVYSPRRHRHGHNLGRKVSKLSLVFALIFITLFTWYSWRQEITFSTIEHLFTPRPILSHKEKTFQHHWCRLQKARTDWKAIIKSCHGNTNWGEIPLRWQQEQSTDAQTSYIFLWDINPAGEFSRFLIHSQTAEGKPKMIGGDAWRVHLSGPAFIAPTVMDYGNGSYEVLFLAMEHGIYRAKIMLDYSLCNGLRDPPADWFIKGNMQGKGQRYPVVDANRDYLLAPLWNGALVELTIPPSTEDLKEWNEYGSYSVFTRQNSCGIGCNFLWDGFGRWVGNRWVPFVPNIPKYHEPHKRQGTLCVYGDSLGVFFADSLYHRRLCRGIFKDCTKKYNWIYPVVNFTVDKSKDDDLDFDIERVLDAVRTLLGSPEMDNESVLIINFGLHFVESINFTTYQRLIKSLVGVFKENYVDPHVNIMKLKFPGRIIWKSSTAINKQRASKIHLGRRRFFTYQRVLLFNAYATSVICSGGIDVLDVYPLSDSYPWGTGTHASHVPAKNDVVHYSNLAFKPAEDFLELMFQP